MRSGTLSNLARLALAAVITGGSLFAGTLPGRPGTSKCGTDDWNFQAEASQLLKDIQSASNALSRDAATLESYTRGGLHWESHAGQLTTAMSHINRIGERLDRLQAIRHAAAPWQQQAIDRIVPVAVNLAERTEAAIEHLNENQGYLWAPSYTDHLKAISDHSDRLKRAVDLHLEMARTQDRLEELRIKAAIGS